ncbi:hypothetical protein DFS33DRAFT_189742 [Desarmillaria ectypa]|nr:hypothetical protein DFS33DRAFT_189742 [Desarmillaria ectypa]
MARSLSAYSFELDCDGSLTEAGTPSTDTSTPVSSYTSSPTTQSDEPHIPRPSNAFFIFRSEFLALHKESLSKEQQKASVLAGAAWRNLPEERQAYYKELARRRREDHARDHPGYKYRPRRSKRGKKADGRKKIDAPQVQIRLDTQSFYYPPSISIATASGVPQPLDPILSSVDLSNQPFITTGNQISFATNQAMYPTQSLYHTPPLASVSSAEPDAPHIEELDPTMHENENLHEFLTRLYNSDPSYLNMMIPGQLDRSLYNEWGSVSDLGYPAADDHMNYSPLLPSLSSMTSDGTGDVFSDLFGSY